MTELMQKVDDLNGLILQGRALEAFEKYYHKDVVMQENEDSPVWQRGKPTAGNYLHECDRIQKGQASKSSHR